MNKHNKTERDWWIKRTSRWVPDERGMKRGENKWMREIRGSNF